jgi:hypothetical protein
VDLPKIVPPDNTPSFLPFHFSLDLYSRYINFFQIVYREMFFIHNLTRVLVHVDLLRITSPDKTPFLLFCFSLALYPRYVDCFQIIKLRTMKLTKHFLFLNGGPVFYLCPCDQKMFMACPLCTRPLCGNHAHSICVEHDMNVADRHIACGYVDPEVRLVHVVMVIKYEVMLLCFQSQIPFCF